MNIEVYDIEKDGKLEEFIAKYPISGAVHQIGTLSGRSPYSTMYSLFEEDSKTRYILWMKEKVSAVVEGYNFNGNGVGKGSEKNVCNLVFNYASTPDYRKEALVEILRLTGGDLVMGVDSDECKVVSSSEGDYVGSDGLQVIEYIREAFEETGHNMIGYTGGERIVLITQSFFDKAKTQSKSPIKEKTLLESAVERAALKRRLFY